MPAPNSSLSTDLPSISESSQSTPSPTSSPTNATIATNFSSSSPVSNPRLLPSWIQRTRSIQETDTRVQPWRATFGDKVDNQFDDGQDLVKIEKSRGGGEDPDCPFRTQGSSLAA